MLSYKTEPNKPLVPEQPLVELGQEEARLGLGDLCVRIESRSSLRVWAWC